MNLQESKDSAHVKPLAKFNEFVKGHLTVLNSVVLASGTLVAILDFLTPLLKLVPAVVYSMTACLTLLMLLAAVAPRVVGRLFSLLGGQDGISASSPLWRSSIWQVVSVILLLVTIIGFSSVAKAPQGGLIASQFPAAKSLQDSLLGLHRDAIDIQQGVDTANVKLDLLVSDSKDPQKDLVARGYTLDDNGLMRAIKQGDSRAVELFEAARYVVSKQGPISVVLNGEQPWRPDVVERLHKTMFATPAACSGGNLLYYELKPPAKERILTFKRLCDTAPWIDNLKRAIAADKLTPAPNEQWERMQSARKTNLAVLLQ